jgi:hypothetical protein
MYRLDNCAPNKRIHGGVAALIAPIAALLVPLAFLAAFLVPVATAPSASAAGTGSATPAAATARIQALLDSPVNNTVNLPHGTFVIRPTLRLHQGERIIGHQTTLTVAAGSGNYAALLAGASPTTDLSGLTITGVTFNQNAAANPIRSTHALYDGQPRFVVLISLGSHITITGNRFTGTDNVNTIVTGQATRDVTISNNVFRTINTPVHDHSSIYTSGTTTTIRNNSLLGTRLYHSAAIEVHGQDADIVGNHVRGYYRGANIACSQTTFSHNEIRGALNPVDLWSIAAPGLSSVAVTHNTLNRNLAYWARLLGSVPPAAYTRQVIRDSSSSFPFRGIRIAGNSG